MKTPSIDDLWLAAQWLDVYEGAEDMAACKRVAAWLLHKAELAEFNQACRKAGVSTTKARKLMKNKA